MIEKYVPLNQAVAEAMLTIGEESDDSRIRNVVRTWVARAAIEIGSSKEQIKICTLKVKDGSAKKPKDCRSIIDVALMNNDQEIPYRYRGGNKRIHEQSRFFYDSTYNLQLDLSEDAYYLHVGEPCDAVTHIIIRYYGFPSVDGDLLIDQDIIPAIIDYVRYANSMRKNDNRSEIAQNRMSWLSSRAAAKSRLKTPSMLEVDELAQSWMSVIPKRFYKDF